MLRGALNVTLTKELQRNPWVPGELEGALKGTVEGIVRGTLT